GAGEGAAQFVDCGHFSTGNLFHERIDLDRRRDDHGAGAPALRHAAFNTAGLGKSFGVREFFAPGFAGFFHETTVTVDYFSFGLAGATPRVRAATRAVPAGPSIRRSS